MSIGVGLGTVLQTDVVLVCIEEISNEVQKPVRTSPLASVDCSIQVPNVGVNKWSDPEIAGEAMVTYTRYALLQVPFPPAFPPEIVAPLYVLYGVVKVEIP